MQESEQAHDNLKHEQPVMPSIDNTKESKI